MLDFLIVGSGLTGATIARELHDAGRSVLVVDRRDHHGGNVHDHLRHGIRVHTYGPHYFRTNNPRLWAWVNRFDSFHPYEAVVASEVDGRLYPWPVHLGKDWWPGFTGTPSNFEEASLTSMPRGVYERFVKGYTEKQWGTDPATLDASLAGRFESRTADDLRLKTHRHQGIPSHGYAHWTANILQGIPLELGVDWLTTPIRARHVVYTGPIDELYGFDLGRLSYRSQHREHTWHPTVQLPVGQVNNPGPGPHVRTLEWWHMLTPQEQAEAHGSVTTTETPFTPDDPDRYEYPYPDQANRDLYQRYKARADTDPSITVCGRLGEYRYYDMDQAIGRGLVIARRLGTESAAA